MAPGPGLDDLIATVRADAAGADELAQVATASRTVVAMPDAAGAALAHFVDHCRRSGGRGRRSARRSASPSKPRTSGSQYRRRCSASPSGARHVSGSHSRGLALRHNDGGTEHVLLALFADEDGLATTVLNQLGAGRADVRHRVVEMSRGYARTVSERDALATWPAVRLARAIRNKEISSRELLALFLDRIERLNGPVNAVVTFDTERAQRAAADADERSARGDTLGPLHGLPVTIKDAIATEGIRSTGGAVELRDFVPSEDAPAVARLKNAGAIVFGKTNLPRWSGDMQTYNEMFGVTNNPWALDRTTGGSSGGAAAAVACGFTSFELGTDIGGSVRLPAHFCGVCSLKPSFGVIPQRGYLDHVGGGATDADINVFGPIARDPDDLALLLDVLAGPGPEAGPAWRLELPSARGASLADFRIGVWLDEPSCRTASDYMSVLTNAVDRLADAGAKLEEAHPPVAFDAQVALFMQLISAAISPSLPAEIADAASGSHLAWLRADEERARLRTVWAEWFESFDVLLCPVMPVAAFRHDHHDDLMARTLTVDGQPRSHLSLISWTGLIGVLYLPSAVVPIGRTAEGLPVGIQIVSPYLHDRRSIRVAQLLRDVLGGYQPPPGFGV